MIAILSTEIVLQIYSYDPKVVSQLLSFFDFLPTTQAKTRLKLLQSQVNLAAAKLDRRNCSIAMLPFLALPETL